MKSIFLLLLVSALLNGCQLFGSKDSDTFTIIPNEVSIADKQTDIVTFTPEFD
jgi:outer membrane biogenesis lipoprotein LolB